jgi:hypothetical protein
MTASLYRLFGSEERLVWTAALENQPQQVWVDPGGRWIVTRGSYCDGTSSEHALVVYGDAGNLLRDWRLEELVSADRVTIVEPHTPWTVLTPLRFESQFNELRVIFPWGESRMITPPKQ